MFKSKKKDTCIKTKKKTLYKVYMNYVGQKWEIFYMEDEPKVFKEMPTHTVTRTNIYDCVWMDNERDVWNIYPAKKMYIKTGTLTYYEGDVVFYIAIEVDVEDERRKGDERMNVWIVYTIDMEDATFSKINGVYSTKEDAEGKVKEVSGKWWECTYVVEWEVDGEEKEDDERCTAYRPGPANARTIQSVTSNSIVTASATHGVSRSSATIADASDRVG